MDVAGAYVSFTEVQPGRHDAYNRWHLFDHLPEQYTLAGVAWGQRWVLVPEQRSVACVEPPLDRIHYVTMYLLAEPFAETVAAFRDLGARLRKAGRFDMNRTSHLAGPLRVAGRWTAKANPIDPSAVPFAPHRGIRVVLDGDAGGAELAAAPGAVGVWTFDGVERLDGRRLTVTWRHLTEGNVARGPAAFDAELSVIDPYGTFDWFD